MEVLGITLARGGSKSIYKKNIHLIDGLPLISYTITEAIQSKLITDYLVSTDDHEIAVVARQYGAKTPFLRPENLSTDQASSVSALQHAVRWAEHNYKKKYDYIVELMCTNPLKKVVDIDKCIEILHETQADSVIAVHKLDDHHPARIKKIVDGFLVDFCIQEEPESRRQDLKPDAYIRSGSIYALKRDYLMNEGRRYGSKNSRAYILPKDKAINIDSEEDMYLAEYLIKKGKKK
jgi:CMP-N,N'-diacetyllegionaminic acid synthase